MKIINYNVNGLRAAIKKDITQWLSEAAPDVLCMQELKLQPDQFPVEIFAELGYHSYFSCAVKKGYSGVAILSKTEPKHVEYGMQIAKYDNEGRFLRADFDDFSVVSVYHPSGTMGEVRQSFKMTWLDDFLDYVKALEVAHPNLVLCGDYNIAHEAIDIHDPIRNADKSGFLPEEREWMTKFLDTGFIDSFRYLHPEEQKYSWWSFRANARNNNKGWRIDYCMVSQPMQSRIKSAEIYNDATHSDHCPIMIEIA